MHAMKANRRLKKHLYSFLSSALDGVSVQTHSPVTLSPRKGPRYPEDEGGLQLGLDASEKR
jgi:hypothetical protein